MSNTSIILIGATFIILIIAGAIILVNSQKKKSSNMKAKIKSQNDFLYTSYIFFSKYTLTKKYIQRVRLRLELMELSDNWTINRKTMKFTYISLGLSLGLFLVMMTIDLSFYYFIISVFTIYIVHNQILKLLIDRIENKILMQFEKYLGDIRHHFHGHGMIDEAIYDSINESDYEISLHATRMYEVLTSDDVESNLDKYNDMMPNKYFRTFLALCYLVQKFGDKVVDGKSMFLTNLNYLKQEINLEFLKRKKIDYLFKSLSIIAIVPIFLIKPIEKWAISNMPDLVYYYSGAYGFVVQIVIFLIVLLSYQMINKMQSSDDNVSQISNHIEEALLKNNKISELMDRVIEKQYSKSIKVGKLLKTVGYRANIEHFYLKRILWTIFGFVLSFMIFLNIHLISRHNILNSQNIDGGEVQQNTLSEAIDREYILKYSGQNPSFNDIRNDLKKSVNIRDSTIIAITAKRILTKLDKYDSHYFKWWELLISVLFALLFYNIPYWIILFRKKIVQMNMEDEVMQFHTIILMLMHIERIAVEDILTWMEQFSNTFKSSISRCINDFEYGDYQALEQLKIDEPFLPFVRIVENLQSASDKISIAQAFDELKIERGFYQQKRKQDNEIMVNKKGMWGKLIAFAPMMLALLLYTILPFILISIKQLTGYSDQLKDIM
ncbi:hypothetical protein [Abyssisolibacter fermentans]|uniref:hypothetical protein n=1 Tax=Abyssisolibacter fermentans TaxID=1766203 RepID=UPI0008361775|nr:hypothetical protein [Abyssisolibacter fermentans]